MRTVLIASVLAGALLLLGQAQAEDPNPDVAKAIQAIAARRAEKAEARTAQLAAWAKGEAKGRAALSSPGSTCTINIGEGGGVIVNPGGGGVIFEDDDD